MFLNVFLNQITFALSLAASSQHIIGLGQSPLFVIVDRNHISHSLLDHLEPGVHFGSHLRGPHYFYFGIRLITGQGRRGIAF